jgi:hypothetical protein
LPIHPLIDTHTIHVSIVSRFKNPHLTGLLPFIFTHFEVDLTSDINKDHRLHLDSPGQSVMERADVPNVLSTKCCFPKKVKPPTELFPLIRYSGFVSHPLVRDVIDV